MIIVTGGGTGGHIFPVVSVIDELRKRGIKDVTWIGVKNGRERDVAKSINVDFKGISAGKLRRYFSLKNFTDVFKILFGIIKSIFLIKRLKPIVVFAKGGFVSVPPVIAAYINRVPVVIHESDIIPGLATKINSRFADYICVSFKKTCDYFKGKKVVFTGNPIRHVIKNANPNRGKRFLDFKEDLPIVFIVGGSLGALSINKAVWDMVKTGDLPFNIVHQCGTGNLNDGLKNRRYKQFEFIESEIGDVIAASDLVVSRAGAGAIYEFSYLKKAMILVPLPRTKSRGEQIKNAKYLKDRGASVIIYDDELNGKTLLNSIKALLDDGKTRFQMGENAFRLIKIDGEKLIADMLIKYRE